MSYKANRGGHAPQDVRDAFCGMVEETFKHDRVKVDVGGDPQTVKWVLGQLWNCTDIMPGYCCDELDLRGKCTYAAGARLMRSRIPPAKR